MTVALHNTELNIEIFVGLNNNNNNSDLNHPVTDTKS